MIPSLDKLERMRADTVIGVTAAELHRLLEALHRAHATAVAVFDHTGLVSMRQLTHEIGEALQLTGERAA